MRSAAVRNGTYLAANATHVNASLAKELQSLFNLSFVPSHRYADRHLVSAAYAQHGLHHGYRASIFFSCRLLGVLYEKIHLLQKSSTTQREIKANVPGQSVRQHHAFARVGT